MAVSLGTMQNISQLPESSSLLQLSSLSVWVLLSLGAGAATAGPGLVFTDVTATAGIGLPGTLNESLAWGDFDGDGDQDLYLTNDGPNKLFRNDGGDLFTEVAAAAGVDHGGFSVGAAFGDLDNDGDLDLYVVSFGTGPDVLYRNDGPIGAGGQQVFTDRTALAGTTEESSSRGVALLDYDHDGWLDIYVNAIGPDILYRNLGGFQFANVAASLGVATVGQGVGAVATDLDGNGWVDLFTGNRSGDLNRLYLNTQGSFTDVTVSAGIDDVGLGMGVLSFDYDNDLDFDLYWTVWPGDGEDPQPNAFYENLGAGTGFMEVAAVTGTTDPDGWGISCNAGDIDNDGWEDFFITNGFSADSSANVLFVNNADGTFSDGTSVLGGADFDGRGVAFADYDEDGDLDLCVTGGPDAETRLWRNDTVNDNHWITLDLQGSASNRSALGARIEVSTQLGTRVKEVSGGAGRGSQNSLPVEFGLGPATLVDTVRIQWPSGHVQVLTNLAVDQYLTVVEDLLFADGFESGDISAWPLMFPSPLTAAPFP
ncbi:MAG: CRTAC1 family protein [Deltaproteobacteria bacterium]|nr:CRTAC1 family protein [Deltaproteobacteria bacterium]